MIMSSLEQYNDVKESLSVEELNMYETLDEKEQLAFLIAKQHLETSFSYYKCNLAKKKNK